MPHLHFHATAIFWRAHVHESGISPATPADVLIHLKPNLGVVVRDRRIGGIAYGVDTDSTPSLTFQALLSDNDMAGLIDTTVARQQGWTMEDPKAKGKKGDSPPNPLCRCGQVSSSPTAHCMLW